MRLTMRWTKLFPLLTGALVLIVSFEDINSQKRITSNGHVLTQKEFSL